MPVIMCRQACGNNFSSMSRLRCKSVPIPSAMVICIVRSWPRSARQGRHGARISHRVADELVVERAEKLAAEAKEKAQLRTKGQSELAA